MASQLDIVSLLKVRGFPFDEMISFLQRNIFQKGDPILSCAQMDALARYYLSHDSDLIYAHLIGTRFNDGDGGMYEFDRAQLMLYEQQFGPYVKDFMARKDIKRKIGF